MDFPFGEAVERLRAGTKIDPYSGEEIGSDWSNPDVEEMVAAVAPGASVEAWQVGRDTVDIAYTLYLPFGADVLVTDRVVVRGETFDVDGLVAGWRSPFTGWEAGTVVQLKRRAG